MIGKYFVLRNSKQARGRGMHNAEFRIIYKPEEIVFFDLIQMKQILYTDNFTVCVF